LPIFTRAISQIDDEDDAAATSVVDEKSPVLVIVLEDFNVSLTTSN
jgi:hypothetical protein